MIRSLMLLLVLFLAGCSHTVHLITEGYSNIQLAELKNKIEQLDYLVSDENSNIPNHYPNTLIASHPLQAPSDISTLQNVLLDSGFSMAQRLNFGQNKHFYSQGHIGLYLRHPDINPAKKMPAYIESENCRSNYATLGFPSEKMFLLETEQHIDGQSFLSTKQGQWQFDGETLHLWFEEQQLNVSFSMAKQIRQTPYGPKTAKVFSPLQQQQQITQLNCRFIVILI